MDAVTAGPGAGGFADRVDGLVANPTRFQKRSLDHKPEVQPRPNLIRPPKRDAFVVAQNLLDGEVQGQINPLFDTERQRPDVEGHGQPTDSMLLDEGSSRSVTPGHPDDAGP